MLPSTSKTTVLSSLLLSSLSAVSAQSEGSVATLEDPTQECTYYDVPIRDTMNATNTWPQLWEIATIPPADTEAQALYNALLPSIPKIAVKGTPDGNFANFTPTYDGVNDPDCWWTYKQCTTPKLKGLQADIISIPEPNTYGLTYDDGPNCSHNAFYDFLRDQKLRATMFFIGSNVWNWPYQAQRALVDGHEICAHTWSHRYMTGLTNEQAFAELYYSKKAIKDVLGVTVQCWRPAFGDVDDRIRYIANALGMVNILWDGDTFDWNYAAIGVPAVDTNYEGYIAGAKNGTYATHGPIILSHELDNTTMSEAEKWLPQIQSSFAHIVPIGVGLNNTNPYLEGTIKYPSFDQFVAGTITLSPIATPTMQALDVSVPFSSGATGSIIPTIVFSGTPVPASTSTTSSSSKSSSTGSSSGSSSSSSDSSNNDNHSAGSNVKVFVGLTLGSIGGILLAL